MFETKLNERAVSIKITRKELIDLMLLCTAHYSDGQKWNDLHEKLKEQLEQFDNKYIAP